MDSLAVECLRCGATRHARRSVFNRFDAPECPQCGYLGWAPTAELTEPERAKLRLRPLPRRRLRPVA